MRENISRFMKVLEGAGADAFISYKPQDTRYLSGMRSSSRIDGHAVVDKSGVWLYASNMNQEQAKAEAFEPDRMTVMAYRATPGQYIADKGYKTVAIEENYITVEELDTLKKFMPETKFLYGMELLNSVRRRKTPEQVAKFREACAITDRIWDCVLNFLRPGVTEQQVESLILEKTKEFGAEAPFFTPIVVSGVRSSQPHGTPTEKVIESGDFVTVDMGVIVDGCPSDFTRTVVVGKASEEQKKVYEAVRAAQQKAVDEIMPGMMGKDADAIARKVIGDAGYGPYFVHGLGHGLDDGFRVSQLDELNILLHEDMMFTVEPGIYIEGFGGVRIEDTVLLTKNGCESLYRSSKQLVEL